MRHIWFTISHAGSDGWSTIQRAAIPEDKYVEFRDELVKASGAVLADYEVTPPKTPENLGLGPRPDVADLAHFRRLRRGGDSPAGPDGRG